MFRINIMEQNHSDNKNNFHIPKTLSFALAVKIKIFLLHISNSFSDTCISVDCSFTIDNVVISAKYNEIPLKIQTEDLENWTKEKVISFVSCEDESSPGILEIKGNDEVDSGNTYMFLKS